MSKNNIKFVHISPSLRYLLLNQIVTPSARVYKLGYTPFFQKCCTVWIKCLYLLNNIIKRIWNQIYGKTVKRLIGCRTVCKNSCNNSIKIIFEPKWTTEQRKHNWAGEQKRPREKTEQVATHVKATISFEVWFSYWIYNSGPQQAIGPVSFNSIGIY